MADLNGWERLDEMILFLRCRARAIGMNPKIQAIFDASDVVGVTLANAVNTSQPIEAQTFDQRTAWLARIQDNVIWETYRKCHRMKRDIAREQDLRKLLEQSSANWEKSLADSGLTPSEAVTQNETMIRIMAAIERLPDRERSVAIAHLLNDQSMTDLAEARGCTKGVVGHLYRNVIEQLRKDLDGIQG